MIDNRDPFAVRAKVCALLTLAAGALMMHCASAAEPRDPQLAGPWVLHEATEAPEPQPEPEPEPCGMAFDPDPDLLKAATEAAARWSAATGCDVRIEAGGIPITVVPPPLFLGDERVCGLSTWDDARTGVQIIQVAARDINCLAPYTVLHEMGHALARAQGHATSGVMAPGKSPARSTRIDSASLDMVCAGLACEAFEPED